MSSVIIRILLRYLAAALIAKGVLSPDFGSMVSSDPDVSMMIEIGIGAVVGILTEGWYYLAHRCGWAK